MIDRYGHVRDAEAQAAVRGNAAAIRTMMANPPAAKGQEEVG
jgi:hypothetical protein